MTRTIIHLRRARDATESSRLMVLVQPSRLGADNRPADARSPNGIHPPNGIHSLKDVHSLKDEDETPLFLPAGEATDQDAGKCDTGELEAIECLALAPDADEAILAVEGTSFPCEEDAAILHVS